MYAAIDLGTSKIAVGIQTKNTLFTAQRASQGIKQGRITSFELLEEPLLEVIYDVEKESRLTLEKVYVSLPVVCTASHHFETEIDIGGKPVTHQHLRSLLTSSLDSSQELIHIFPKSYTLDENENICDPLNMIGHRLRAHLHIVTAQKSYIKNLRHLIGRCHLDIEGFIVAPYASSLAVLTDEELEVGVTVIDMGAGTTSLCSFYENQLVHLAGIPLGGCNVTQDIACAFGGSFSEGERLKILHGSLHDSPDMDVRHNTLQTPDLSFIIRARIEEILEMIMEQCPSSIPKRLVLTGGASQLSGLEQEVSQGWRVRIGKTDRRPIFTTLMGLLHYARQDSTEKQWSQAFAKRESFFQKLWNCWKISA